MVFAFKCYADRDVYAWVRLVLNLNLKSFHGGGQGEVINALINDKADVGMVDQDPFGPHHRERDNFQLVRSIVTAEVRRRGSKYLVVIKPELEQCFLHEIERLGLDSQLPNSAAELRTLLNIPEHRKHEALRTELAAVYQRGRERGLATFLSEVEAVIRELQPVHHA